MGSTDESFFTEAKKDLMAGIDTSVPHSARIWNYWLGGKDNFPVDQEAGDQYCEVFPNIVELARVSRDFLGRAVRHLAAEERVRQFLDIGTGLPTEDNTHQVAQRVAPESHVVYVDNDPLVLAHARALLTSRPDGATHYLDADLREPEKILSAAHELLNFDEPVALMLMGVMGHVNDDDEALSIVRRLVADLPSGGFLVLEDGTDTDQAFVEAQQGYDDTGAVPYRLRGPEQIARFFDGLELLEPGVVSLPCWRPDPSPLGPPAKIDAYGAVARKP